MKLPHPSLSILLGAIEAKSVDYSVSELRLLPIKLSDTQFTDSPDDILQVNEDWLTISDSNSEDLEEESMAMETFVGDGGEVYELRKTHAGQNNNKKGAAFSAVKNSRAVWNWNNKGGNPSSNSTLMGAPENRSLRCGQEGNRRGRCRPFKKFWLSKQTKCN